MIDRKYTFVCKKCWHIWEKTLPSGEKKPRPQCPKCKSADVDVSYEILG